MLLKQALHPRRNPAQDLLRRLPQQVGRGVLVPGGEHKGRLPQIGGIRKELPRRGQAGEQPAQGAEAKNRKSAQCRVSGIEVLRSQLGKGHPHREQLWNLVRTRRLVLHHHIHTGAAGLERHRIFPGADIRRQSGLPLGPPVQAAVDQHPALPVQCGGAKGRFEPVEPVLRRGGQGPALLQRSPQLGDVPAFILAVIVQLFADTQGIVQIPVVFAPEKRLSFLHRKRAVTGAPADELRLRHGGGRGALSPDWRVSYRRTISNRLSTSQPSSSLRTSKIAR